MLGVSAGLAEQVRRNLVLRTAPTAQAVRIYTGVLYQALDHASLDAAAKRRANATVVVLSAAFGALRLTDRVPAYRVDICARVPGIGALDQQWRPALAEALDAAVKPRELVVDCRSSTYAAMWRPQGTRAERWVRVTVPGASHHAKHTRGLVTRELSRAEAPRTPGGLAERLSGAFEVDLTPPDRPGRPWTLAVQESARRAGARDGRRGGAMTDLAALAERVVPVLVFLVAITVVAEICDLSGVFDEAAHLAARAARGRVIVLWLLVVLLACACTVLLSLDTTAVLLTPVAVTVARQVGVAPLPFAMTTLWLANTASLLLPVSNLTNLLALHRFDALGLSVTDYVGLLWPAALVAIVLTVVVLWLLHRRDLRGRYDAPPHAEPHDRTLMLVSAVVAALLAPAFVAGITPAWPATIAAVILLAVTAVRAPDLCDGSACRGRPPSAWPCSSSSSTSPSAPGSAPGSSTSSASGTSAPDLLRLSAVGAVASNAINNLPAYLALEVTADHSPVRLAALLVGVNAGPIVTVWGSLATILWAQRCRRRA